MTMQFRQLKASVIALLEANAVGLFRVEGSQPQAQSAEEFLGNDRSVRVFYGAGDFTKSSSSMAGPFTHEVNFGLQFTIVQPATVDLSVLTDPNATPAQRIAALAASGSAADLADDSFDEFVDLVFQILMDARNQWLGLPKYSTGDRWVSGIKKNDVETFGEYVVLTGQVILTASLEEVVEGETPIAGDILSGDIEIKDDPEQQTGLEHDIS